jgi:tripartite-type tricarboxylate transporter receptor subunit TctC
VIAEIKRNPGKYSFGSAGSGTTLHLAGEMFKHLAGVDMQHIPYRGSAPAQVDLMAGRVQMMFDNMPGTLALSRDGKVRPIAVTSLRRSPVAPEIPAISEFLPGFDVISWTCITGPANLPRAMVARLSRFTRQAMESADLVQAYFNQGAAAWFTGEEEIN